MTGLAALGAPMQLAFVSVDVDRALAFWTGTLGAGPFFHLPHVALEGTRYRGMETNPDFSLWLGYWGEMQIELIAQHNDAASIYLGVADDRRLHHVCLLVDDLGLALSRTGGAEVLQDARVPGGGAVAYVQPAHGPIVELLQPAPGTRELFGMMQAAHHGWDGKEPVRSL
jgi:catechol 2,3-dioxygenase-like lactoylglutathione lyase family enzyme